MIYRRIEIRRCGSWYGPNCLVSWAGATGLSHHRRKQRKVARSGGRFWWTDRGWRRYGHAILAACKAEYGDSVRLLRRKDKSKPIFADRDQACLL